MALSALARYMRKNRMLKFGTGAHGRRTSPLQPAPEGFTRGSLGSMGSSPLRTRNPDAGENKERSELGLPMSPMSQMTRGGK